MIPDWSKLTAAQKKLLSAVCEHGGTKIAAYNLNISIKTAECHAHKARERCGLAGTPGMLMYLEWDRYTRGLTP